jgi:hypothetical protein
VTAGKLEPRFAGLSPSEAGVATACATAAEAAAKAIAAFIMSSIRLDPIPRVYARESFRFVKFQPKGKYKRSKRKPQENERLGVN